VQSIKGFKKNVKGEISKIANEFAKFNDKKFLPSDNVAKLLISK